MYGHEKVLNVDRPSLRDDKYAERQYLNGLISYQDYMDVLNFYPIYSDFYTNRIYKIRIMLTKRNNNIPVDDREIFNYLESYVD